MALTLTQGLDSLPEVLPAFLVQQRWFGSKSRTIARCEVEDSAELPHREGEVTAVVAGISYSDATRERYALLLARRQDADRFPVLGRLPDPDGDWIVEAATDPVAARAFLRGFGEDSPIPTRRGGILRYADVGAAARRVLADATPTVKALGSEQSNTSLRVGSTLAFKLFRRLEPGENPELEVGRFLTSRTSFRAMSALEGSLTYCAPSGDPATLGVLQTWIDNHGDGWSYVLAELGESRRSGTPPPQLTSDMTRLGAITADFHAALESDGSVEAFRPEPVQSSDIDRWSAQLLDRISRACALIESQLAAWPDETRRLGESLLAKSHVARAIAAAGSHAANFHRMRIHGDYHLGQTLKTPSGFAIIDFEGEPATPIAVRRQKHCALKDVAGMLRSFEYAIQTASGQPPRATDRLWMPPALRVSFLASYLRSALEHGILSIPAAQPAIAQWLTFFELDKALYELEYEVNNRPAWAHIPLRGILRALDTQGGS